MNTKVKEFRLNARMTQEQLVRSAKGLIEDALKQLEKGVS